MRCALVSNRLNLRGYLGAELARITDRIEAVDHSGSGIAADVRLAVAWHPPDDAFERYPNLRAVCSIGAGVDNIVACPSLPPEAFVVRVADPAQAQMMSGFVAWHVIGHQRQFGHFRAQQHNKIWQRIEQRSATCVPVGVLGHGVIGQRVAADLALLGFPVMSWSRTAKPVSIAVRGVHGTPGLADLLENTEVLVNLLPLTRETEAAFCAEPLLMTPRGAMAGKYRACRARRQGGQIEARVSGFSYVALDALWPEPSPPSRTIWMHPTVTVMPHVAHGLPWLTRHRDRRQHQEPQSRRAAGVALRKSTSSSAAESPSALNDASPWCKRDAPQDLTETGRSQRAERLGRGQRCRGDGVGNHDQFVGVRALVAVAAHR